VGRNDIFSHVILSEAKNLVFKTIHCIQDYSKINFVTTNYGNFGGKMRKLDINAPVIIIFAAISFAVLGLDWLTNSNSTRLLFAVGRPQSLLDPLFYVRLFGHSLGHANLSHYLNNFIIILLVGPVLEEKYGAKNLLLMIAATTLIIGILHSIISPSTMLLGASGVAFMLIILNSYVNLKAGKIPVTLILCIAIFLGREVVEQVQGGYGDISHFAHIIGGMCGAIFGFIIHKDTIRGAK